MSSVAFLAGPAFALLGAYALLKAYDEDERRLVRLGLGALLLAVAVTALGALADRPAPSSPQPAVGSSSA